MTREVVTVTPDTNVADIARLMLERRISGVPVVDRGVPVGMISESDLLRRPETGTAPQHSPWLELFVSRDSLAHEYTQTHSRCARDVMTPGVISVTEATSVAQIAELLESRHIKRVPVVAVDGRLVGSVSRANLLQSLASRAAPPTAVTVDDQRIRDALLQELSTQDWAGSPDPGNVIVEDGVVHLWGRIRSAEVRKAMVVAAQNVAGVKSVEDHMDRERDHDNMTWPNWPSPERP